MSGPNHEPLRVDFHLSGLMAEPEYPLALDGLLAWAAVQWAQVEGQDHPLQAQTRLPLAWDSENGVWQASWLFRAYDGPIQLQAMVKRSNGNDFVNAKARGDWNSKVTKIAKGSGQLKGSVLEVPVRQVSVASAWCVGDRALIEEHLSLIRGIGPYRRLGLGRTHRIEVVADPDAHHLWANRSMPEPRDGFLAVEGVLSPPYWRRDRLQTVWVPKNDRLFT